MSTESPSPTATSVTVPARSATTSFSIFIASRTQRTAPDSTSAPSATSTDSIVPCISAVTSSPAASLPPPPPDPLSVLGRDGRGPSALASGAWIGGLWALGVIAEIGVFLAMQRLLPRFRAAWLLLVSLVLTALRWLLIAMCIGEPAILIAAQTLHAASFGLYHAVAIALIDRFFRGPHQGRGQALYSSLSFGAGQAAGSFAAGLAYGAFGGTLAFMGGAGVASLALLVAATGLRKV